MRCATPSATSITGGVSTGEVMSAMLARVALTIPEVTIEDCSLPSKPCALIVASVHMPQGWPTIAASSTSGAATTACATNQASSIPETKDEVLNCNAPTSQVLFTGKQTVVTPPTAPTGNLSCPTCGSFTGSVCPTCLGVGSVSCIGKDTSISNGAAATNATQFTQVPVTTLTGPSYYEFSSRAVEDARRAASESFISKAAEYLRQNFAGRNIEEVALCTDENLRRAVSHQPMIYTEEVAKRHRNLNNFLEPKAREGTIIPTMAAGETEAEPVVTVAKGDMTGFEEILALLK